MQNNCSSEESNDPINDYIKNCKIDIETVPIEIIRESALLYNHRIEGDYIYGVKLLSKNFTDTLTNDKTPPYEVGKTYYYDEADSELSKFNNCCYAHKIGAHGAGLWASPCFEKSVVINKRGKFNIPILVRFPLQSTIVLGNYAIKGKIMEVVSIKKYDVKNYLF